MAMLSAGEYHVTPPTLTDGKTKALQLDVNGNLKVTGAGTTTVAGEVDIGAGNTIGLDAGTNHIGQVGTPADLIDVTMTCDTSALAIGDVATDTATITGAVRANGGRAILESILLLDEDDQGAALDIYFFKTNVSLGTKNSAPNISDSDARNLLGYVSIASADYKDLGGCKVVCVKGIGLMLEADTAATSCFVSIVSQGAPTYTANGLRLKLGMVQA